jgi:hypothetical protein
VAPPQPIQVLEPLPWSRSTVTPLALNKLVKGGMLVSAGEGMYPRVDGPADVGQGAQPVIRLRRQLHSAARARLHRPSELLHAGVVIPLRGGAP